MAEYDRFDICEAHYCLESDWNISGVLQERKSNQRRKMSTGFQLSRMNFKPRPDLSFGTLTDNGQAIYDELKDRYNLIPPREKQEAMIAKFQKWIDQRPGLDPYNYSGRSQINTEYKHISAQKRRAQRALNVVYDLPYAKDTWKGAFRAFSGRLSLNDKGDLEYCTGQYWPTEYRLAAAVVLESYIFYACSGHREPAMKVIGMIDHYKGMWRWKEKAEEWGKVLGESDLLRQQDKITIDQMLERDRKVFDQQDKIKDSILRDAVVGLTRYYRDQYKENEKIE